MARVIQEYIKKPLAELVLFGSLSTAGGTVHVRVSDTGDTLSLDVESSQPQEQELEALS